MSTADKPATGTSKPSATTAITAAAALLAGLAGGIFLGPGESADCQARTDHAIVEQVRHEVAQPGAVTKAELNAALAVKADCEPATEPTSTDEPTTDAPPATTEPTGPPATTDPSPPSDPAPGGDWPTVETTGVPEGVTLTESGSLTLDKPGAVVDSLHITGTIKVKANDVTIRRSRIDNTGRYPIQVDKGVSGFLLEDSEIDGHGLAQVAILYGGYTLRRVEIRDCLDGPRIEADDVLIEDSLIHELHRVEGGHHDTIQIRKGRNIVIRNNTLLPYNASTGDPMNAAIQIGSALGDVPISGLVVEGNYMDGGNYTINGGSSWVTEAVYRNNTFGPHARYGIKTNTGPGTRWEPSNHMVDGTPAK